MNEVKSASSGNEEKPRKSTYKLWWVWIILVVIVTLLFFMIRDKMTDKKQNQKFEDKKVAEQNEEPEVKEEKKNKGDFTKIGETKPFSNEQLITANAALEAGIKIDDPQNDWLKVAKGTTQPDGKEDNSEPYPLGWSDLKSLNIGADENYIYIKFNLWDRFPSTTFSYNGDKMDGGSFKINYFTFQNSEGKKDWADLITSMSLREQSNGDLAPTEIIAMISPKGRDTNYETQFTTYSADGLSAGGHGQDYLLSAFPLNNFSLKLGEKVTFDCTIEVGSEKYHHESIDLLFGRDGSKFADTIEYVLGSNTYTSSLQQNMDSHS